MAALGTQTKDLETGLSSATPQNLRPQLPPDVKAHALDSFANLPLMFEPNVGQINLAQRAAAHTKNQSRNEDGPSSASESVKFLAHGSGYTLFLTAQGAVMTLRSPASSIDSLNMKLVGANPSAKVEGDGLLPGKTNYFIGGDSSLWRTNVSQFARVRYENVYPGINLVFYGHQGQLEYDFQVAPGANPAQAEIEFDGSKRLELRDGSIIVKGRNGSVRLESPRAYQQVDGHEQPVASHFVLRAGNRVGFELGPYDRARELVIDPILTYSTFFGGTGDETCPSFAPPFITGLNATPGCPAIAVDGAADIYLAGATNSPVNTFPTPASGTTTLLGTNANIYVAKLDPTGQILEFLTFLGGGGTDVNSGMAVDGAGNIYLAGTTTSGINGTANFPTTASNAYQIAPEAGSKGTSHVFVSVLAGSGSHLIYSSYLSGNGTDIASGMTISPVGSPPPLEFLYVTGTTTSTDVGSSSVSFPATAIPEIPPFQATSRAPIQFFVTQVNPGGFEAPSINYSTYFGGGVPSNPSSETDIGGGITVDQAGNIYFSGTTNFIFTGTSPNTDFPIVDAYQPCLNTPPPIPNTNPQSCSTTNTSTNTDAFVAKLETPNIGNAGGTGQLLWSTYFGGSGNDSSTALAIDTGAANVYLTGSTNSPNIIPVTTPITFQPFQDCLNTSTNPSGGIAACPTAPATPPTDAYVSRLNNPAPGTIQALTYFSYLGGSDNDGGLAITVDPSSGALLTGFTQSPDFPVVPSPSPIQSHLQGTQDAFLSRLNTQAQSGQTAVGSYSNYFGGGTTATGGSATNTGTSITLDTNLNTYFAGMTNSVDLQTAAPLQRQNAGGFDAFTVRLGTAADLGISGVLSLGSGQTFIGNGQPATFNYTVINNGPDLATNVTVTDNFTPAVTGLPLKLDSASVGSGLGTCSQPSSNTTPMVCNIGSLQAGSTVTISIVLTPLAAGSFNGGAVTVSSPNNNDPDLSNNTAIVPAQASDFAVSITPPVFNLLAAGDTATYIVTLSPQPVYGANIALSCSTPSTLTAATCTATPNSVTLASATPQTATLNITTTARPVPVANARPWPGRIYALWLAVPGLALLGLGARDGRRRRRLIALLVLCVLFGLTAGQIACSHAAVPPLVGGTSAGTFTVTLTATAGSDTKNQFVTLVVP
jgi:uncharacterized repeat protein (TIGR01451 family)